MFALFIIQLWSIEIQYSTILHIGLPSVNIHLSDTITMSICLNMYLDLRAQLALRSSHVVRGEETEVAGENQRLPQVTVNLLTRCGKPNTDVPQVTGNIFGDSR